MAEKLTVVIPCKNERENILPCLESILPIADEILVADSGSTDGTLELVEKVAGCRVITRPWDGYARFKNWAVRQARHPWVLCLDADERVTPQLGGEIRQALTDAPDHINAYSVAFQTYFLGQPLRYSSWNNRAIRLVRREHCRFQTSRVHESVAVDPANTAELQHPVLHYSIRSYDQFFAKYARYSKLAAEEMYEKGRRASVASLLIRPFLRFFHMYFVRRGFLDGKAGIQVCILMSFFYSFAKQARLWEMDAASDASQSAETSAGESRATAPQYVVRLPSPKTDPGTSAAA